MEQTEMDQQKETNMNSNSERERSKTTKRPNNAGLVGVAVGILAVVGVLFAFEASDGDPNDAQSASESSDQVAPSTPPDALPFVEDGDPCSLTLHEAIAGHDNIADGLHAWSDHLREVAVSAPDDVAAALDDLASSYAVLADAQPSTLSVSTSEFIEVASDNPATNELVDVYLESNCA